MPSPSHSLSKDNTQTDRKACGKIWSWNLDPEKWRHKALGMVRKIYGPFFWAENGGRDQITKSNPSQAMLILSDLSKNKGDQLTGLCTTYGWSSYAKEDPEWRDLSQEETGTKETPVKDVEEDLRKRNVRGWRAKTQHRQNWRRIVLEAKVPTGL
jgi:hypothetical protein